MHRVIQVRTIGAQRDRWVHGYRWAASQPGWVMRLALVIFLLVVAIPFAVLIVLAALLAVVAGGTLALAGAAFNSIHRLFQSDGRSNVRVIRRDDRPPGS